MRGLHGAWVAPWFTGGPQESVEAPSAGPAPAPAAALATAPGPGPEPASARPPEAAEGPPLPEPLVGAPLLAAGVLGALGRRRRAALTRAVTGGADTEGPGGGPGGPGGGPVGPGGSGGVRSPCRTGVRGVGDEWPAPSGPAAAAHDALRVGADPASVRFLDGALRELSAALAERAGRAPVVYAAWLSAQELHLQFAEDAAEPPPPWRFGQSAQFWSVRRADAGTGDERAPAPYPGLVGLGTRGEARLLLNLEAVPGLVSVAGGEEERTGVLAAVAAELATGERAATTAVTLVGFGAELTALAPGRVRHLPDVPALLRALETPSAASGEEPGPDSGPEPPPDPGLAPHLVLVGAEPTGDEAERLAALAADPGRRCGFLVGHAEGRVPGAVWEFTAGDGALSAAPLGLELRTLPLARAVRGPLAELFTAADTEGDPTEGNGPAFRADLSDGGRPDVYARLLGPYEILGLAEPEEAHSALLHEALALLLLHREGLHPRVLAAAVGNRGGDPAGALVERLGAWLGTEQDGTPRLGADRAGRLTLRPSVVSDWDVLRTLHHGTTGERGARLTPPVRRQQLLGAMELARGPLLADRTDGAYGAYGAYGSSGADRAYGWLAHETTPLRHPLIVTEVGLALSAVHLRLGAARRAVDAVRAALRSAPGEPRLRAELLRTAHAAGEPAEPAAP